MKIVIAPQTFKNCASAQVIAGTIAAGVHRALPHAEIVLAPIADGGDGSLDILLSAKSGIRHYTPVMDAFYQKKFVHWGGLINAFPKTAIIESAKVCGLASLQQSQKNPLVTTTYGVGELINEAIKNKYAKIFIGLGGNATNDAGVGLAEALGVQFLNKHGKALPKGGGSLTELKHIDTRYLNPFISQTEILAGCDVRNFLTGPEGASRFFSPQKGASKDDVDKLEEGFENFISVIKQELGIDLKDKPYLGAAGGTPASLLAFCQAKLISGADWIFNEIQFDRLINGADLIITGEGCFDMQTYFHKAPYAVIKNAQKKHIPVIVLAGSIADKEKILKTDITLKENLTIIAVSSQKNHIPHHALSLLAQTAERAMHEFFSKER